MQQGIAARVIGPAAMLAVTLMGVGCATGGRSGSGEGPAQWGIVLTVAEGQNHVTRGQQLAARFQQITGMEGFHAVNEGRKSVVYFGRYPKPGDDQAQRDLARLRQYAGRGVLPGHALMLSPIAPGVERGASLDLRNVTGEEAVYTLQVAVFKPPYPDYRQSAEDLARQYRQAGHQAYYYHGPSMSLVTVGVFTHAAARVATEGPRRGQPVYHKRIRTEFQGRFPHLLVNGEKVPVADGESSYSPTFLVRIPK